MSARTFTVMMHDWQHLPELARFAVIWLVVFCLLVATEIAGLFLLNALR